MSLPAKPVRQQVQLKQAFTLSGAILDCLHCIAVQGNAAQSREVELSAVQCSEAQCSAVQCSVVKLSAVHCSA